MSLSENENSEESPTVETDYPASPITAPTDQLGNASERLPRQLRHRTTVVLALLAGTLGGGLAGHFSASVGTKRPSGPVINSSTNVANPAGAVLSGGYAIPTLVKNVQPSVVSIDVRSATVDDQGTGMVVSSQGLVVTNNHVIAAANPGGTISVTLTGSLTSYPATLVGTSSHNDIALIKIDNAANLRPVTFGNSSALEVGDSVVAIGNALGLSAETPTVTSGIVSALGRTVTATGVSATETLVGMIQTDAAINPGNSGGPLLDAQGDVVGMNTAVAGTLSDGSSAQNIGFAIPISKVTALLKSLESGIGIAGHGSYLGVQIASVTPALRAQYGFHDNVGVVVLSVTAGSPAASARIQPGDVIESIDSITTTTTAQVVELVQAHRAGTNLVLHIERGSHTLTVNVTLAHE